MHEVAVFKRAKTTLAGVIFIKLKPRLTRAWGNRTMSFLS